MPLLYPLDTTGFLPANKVTAEVHTLLDKPVRAIAPLLGAFFCDSVSIRRQDTGASLKAGIDYIFSEYYRSLSLRFRIHTAGMILITNPAIKGNIEIDYQAVGSWYTVPSNNAGIINAKPNEHLQIPHWAEIHQPGSIFPNKTIVEFDSSIGFEYLAYAIERYRQYAAYPNSAALEYSLKLIEEFKSKIMAIIDTQIDVNLKPLIEDYKRQFSSYLAGLENIVNLQVASYDEGYKAGKKDYQYTDSDQKYVASAALSGFKQALYDFFIDTQETGIDRLKGISIIPRLDAIAKMSNGTRYVFDSIVNMQAANVAFEEKVYPNTENKYSKWVIYKTSIANNEHMLLAFDMTKGYMYSGIYTPLGNPQLQWMLQITSTNTKEYIELIEKHILDENNPHHVTKFQVALGDVENLPIAEREDIVCRKPSKKYVTHDGLLLFWKLYLKDIKKLGDQEGEDDKVKVADRIKLILAPCGPCGEAPKVTEPKRKDPIPYIRPRDQLLAVWCVKNDRYGRFSDGFGKSYEKLIEKNSNDCKFDKSDLYKERGYLISTYCDGLTQYGKYSDGKGSYYVSVIKENASECGGTSTVVAYVEVKNKLGVTIGLGYSLDYAAKDSDAGTILTDEKGNRLCYIFSSLKMRTVDNRQATVELKSDNGKTIGYLMRK